MGDYNDNLAMVYGLWGMGEEDQGAGLATTLAANLASRPTRRRVRRARRDARRAAKGRPSEAHDEQLHAAALAPIPDEVSGGYLVIWSDALRPSVKPVAVWVPRLIDTIGASFRFGKALSGQALEPVVAIKPYSEALRARVLDAQANAATGLL